MAELIQVRRVSDGRILKVTRQFFKTMRGFELITEAKPQKRKRKADVKTD